MAIHPENWPVMSHISKSFKVVKGVFKTPAQGLMIGILYCQNWAQVLEMFLPGRKTILMSQFVTIPE